MTPADLDRLLSADDPDWGVAWKTLEASSSARNLRAALTRIRDILARLAI